MDRIKFGKFWTHFLPLYSVITFSCFFFFFLVGISYYNTLETESKALSVHLTLVLLRDVWQDGISSFWKRISIRIVPFRRILALVFISIRKRKTIFCYDVQIRCMKISNDVIISNDRRSFACESFVYANRIIFIKLNRTIRVDVLCDWISVFLFSIQIHFESSTIFCWHKFTFYVHKWLYSNH